MMLEDNEIKLKDLKKKSVAELLAMAEEMEIENVGNLRRQDLLFAVLKKMASDNTRITGNGVLEVLQDGFDLPTPQQKNKTANKKKTI